MTVLVLRELGMITVKNKQAPDRTESYYLRRRLAMRKMPIEATAILSPNPVTAATKEE